MCGWGYTTLDIARKQNRKQRTNMTFLPCRHSEDMIEKLESAGLGFYVRATETQQKLGTDIVHMSVPSLQLIVDPQT